MIATSSLLFSKIRPSTLRVRVPRVGFCDDDKRVAKSLRNIRKQLGIGSPPSLSTTNRDFNATTTTCSSSDAGADGISSGTDGTTLVNRNSDPIIPNEKGLMYYGNGSVADPSPRAIVDMRNRLHKSLWVAMKRRNSLSFHHTCKQLRNSGLQLDAVSYTLMINGTLIFSKSHEMNQVLGMIGEMKELGLHPALIRFLARLISIYLEMCYYDSRPLISDWLAVTRSSWLTAHLITVRSSHNS